MTPAVRKDAARNSQRILDVARSRLADGASLQLNEVARQAGVGVATVYRHFPTPEALLEAVAAEGLEALIGYGEAALADGDAWHGFATFLGHVVDAQINDPSISPVAAAAADTSARTTELKARLTAVSTAGLARVRDGGLITAELADGDLVPLLCGIAYAASAHGGDKDAITDSARRYLELLLNGIRTSADPG